MSSQYLLAGITCRDEAKPCECAKYGVIGRKYCDANDGQCCSPYRNPSQLRVINAIGGLDFRPLTREIPIPKLPKVIPLVRGDSTPRIPLSNFPVFGTRYTDIRRLHSRGLNAVSDWRRLRRVTKSQLVFLHQETADKFLERLFTHWLDADFFGMPAQNLVLVGAGYSVYDTGEICEWHELINLSRSVEFAYRANQAGFPTIPSIGWSRHRERDIERLANWLVASGDCITHLAVNVQTGGDAVIEATVQGMRELEARTQREYKWLVFGLRKAHAIISKHIDSRRIVLCSNSPVMKASVGRNLDGRIVPGVAIPELARANIESLTSDWYPYNSSQH